MSEVQNTTAVHPLEEMGISPEVVQAFDWMGFKNLTAIQEKCIPLMMDGHDTVSYTHLDVYKRQIVICFFLVLVREGVYIGYLFLIGAEQSIVTILRALLCSAYSAVMILPCSLIQNKIMNVHIIRKKKNEDLVGDSEGAGRKR